MYLDRDSHAGSGHFAESSVACPLPGDGHADTEARLEELLRRLPAERRSSLERPVPARASLVLEPDEWKTVRHAAAVAAARPEDLVLAGFSGLLSRLSWQEAVSVLRYSPALSLSTILWEQGVSFGKALAAIRHEQLRDAHVSAGASYQFLEEGVPSSTWKAVDLSLTAKVEAGRLVMVLSSASGRWRESTLRGWLESLRCLTLAAAAHLDAPIRTLPLLDENAVLDFYKALNRTATDFPAQARAHDLVTRQAELNPDAVAVVFANKRLSYRELDEQSTLRAKYLAAMGAGPNRPVAICMERSEQLPVALLAVLKAGSCYVPLDPQHPRQRIAMTLEECKPVAILSDSNVAASLGEMPAPVLHMDEDWPSPPSDSPEITPASPNDLAYIIYTSGSTGKPKGVQIRHRPLVSLFDPKSRMPGLAPGDRLLAITTISFDIATLDMLMPLSSGATLVVADRYAAGDPFELAQLLQSHDVTFLQATPFTWRLLVNSGWTGKHDLRMISGGEALPRDLANRLLPLGRELWNCYGPTETTIYSGSIRLRLDDGIVPLGPPIANTTFYVADETGRPLPPGVPGELCIGGVGVSPGYLERRELTAQRFVPDIFSLDPGAMVFRTGDLVRALSHRELEFMGRLDHQVKLRGYRIELAEIESALRSHAAIENAAVILREDILGEPRLVAYVTLAHGNSVEPNDLKKYAGGLLPEYMLPARIVTMDALPLTSSGKIDRRSLPSPESVSGQSRATAAGVAPESEIESRLLEIFREVLDEPSIGVTDSFFDYGGYSLLTARLFSRIYRALGQKLPISLLFDAPTVRGLARIIHNGQPLPIVVPIRKEGRAAPLFVIHSYLIYEALNKAIEEDRPIFGVRELDDNKPVGSLEQRAAIYAQEISRIYPQGPLSLAGWCLAGSLTVEVARILRDQGRIVAMVALFDAERPGYKPRIEAGGSLFKARLLSFTRFHSDRMRELDWPERVRYLSAQSVHRWDDIVEASSVWRRTAFRWTRQKLGFIFPKSMRGHLERLGADDLRPTALQSYPGKIVLFRASDVVQISGTEPSLGWNTVAKDGVVVEFAPGDHESMFREPHLPKFGKMLERVLREGEASCAGTSPIRAGA
jgi:amino acid adenylation domain-containing protein